MIHSTTHITSNQAGLEQVDIERDMTLWEILKKAWLFKSFEFSKVTTDRYVNLGGKKHGNAFSVDVWVDYEDYFGLGIRTPATDSEMVLITGVQIQIGLNRLAERNMQ